MDLRRHRIQFRIECLYNLDRSLDEVGNKRRLCVVGNRVSVFRRPTSSRSSHRWSSCDQQRLEYTQKRWSILMRSLFTDVGSNFVGDDSIRPFDTTSKNSHFACRPARKKHVSFEATSQQFPIKLISICRRGIFSRQIEKNFVRLSIPIETWNQKKKSQSYRHSIDHQHETESSDDKRNHSSDFENRLHSTRA